MYLRHCGWEMVWSTRSNTSYQSHGNIFCGIFLPQHRILRSIVVRLHDRTWCSRVRQQPMQIPESGLGNTSDVGISPEHHSISVSHKIHYRYTNHTDIIITANIPPQNTEHVIVIFWCLHNWKYFLVTPWLARKNTTVRCYVYYNWCLS